MKLQGDIGERIASFNPEIEMKEEKSMRRITVKLHAINQSAVECFQIDPTLSLSMVYLNSFVNEDASRVPTKSRYPR